MSKATKRKHVTKEVLDEFVLPTEMQQIVKVGASRGNNLHEVETPDKQSFLASMPTKFRRNVWIKRGNFVIVERIEEGDKVKGEIVNILYKEQIKYIKEQGKWPAGFTDVDSTAFTEGMIPDDMLPPCDSDSDDDEHIGDMVVNMNRQQQVAYVEDDTSSDADEDVDDT